MAGASTELAIKHILVALAAERLQVPWTFRVTRGRFPQEVLAVAEQMDLLIFGKTGNRRHLEWASPGAAAHLTQMANGELALLIPQAAPGRPRMPREGATAHGSVSRA